MKKLEYKTIKLDGFKVMGISIKTSPKNGQDMKDIKALWNKFYGENILQSIPYKENYDVLAFYYHYESDQNEPYSFLIGAKVSLVDKIPAGLEIINVPAQQYTIFTAEGDFPKCLLDTWHQIWDADISRTFSYDFEEYDENFFKAKSENKKVKLFISSKEI